MAAKNTDKLQVVFEEDRKVTFEDQPTEDQPTEEKKEETPDESRRSLKRLRFPQLSPVYGG